MKMFIQTFIPASLLLLTTVTGCSDDNRGEPTVQQEAPAVVPESSADLLIRGGNLLDMVLDQPEVVPLKGLVINAGRIDQIIRADSDIVLPSARQTVDAGSFYILPGFIDAHVHFRPWFPEPAIYFGVTTMMDTGPCTDCADDPNEWILGYKSDFDMADSNGPTLYVTGTKVDGPEGEVDAGIYRFQSLDDIPQRIAYLAGLGVDGIKAEENLPPEFRRKVIEEANNNGLPVVGHSKDALESISVGMKFIEHMYPISRSISSNPELTLNHPRPDHFIDMDKAPELINAIVNNEVYVNPTMLGRYGYVTERWRSFTEEDEQLLKLAPYNDVPEQQRPIILNWYNRMERLSETDRQDYIEGYERVKMFIKDLSQAGGLILAATDTGDDRMPGITMSRELQLLVDAGVTPYKALLGATRWPAQLMRKADMIGTIEEGKQADIIIIGSNPLEQISAVKDVHYVIYRGDVKRRPENNGGS